MRLVSLPLGLLSLLTVLTSATQQETYGEILRLQSLPDGKVHSSFEFILRGPWLESGTPVGPNAVAHHHTLLPPQLTSLLLHYHITSFFLTLSSGRWASSWPHLPTAAAPIPSSPASGIELTAWLELLEGENEEEEEKRWEGFKGALGGLFCAGIGGGAGRGESRPLWGYPFEGAGEESEHRLYRTLLPRLSATCTESLTPFLALLPCASHAGLSSLLNPHKLFDGDWTLLGVHFVRGEDEGVVRLEVGSVGDPVRLERLRGGMGKRDFSMMELYDRKVERACPVATKSEVQLVIPVDSTNPFAIEPRDGMVGRREGSLELGVWDTTTLAEDQTLDVQVKWEGEMQFRHPRPSKLPLSPISARRLLAGVGQERGSIGVEITNNLDRVAEVVWIETWPWWVRGFISTLEGTLGTKASSASPKILDLDYTPPIARQRPTTLQALLSLPPHSTSRFLLSYESSYLWYTEYPSDAHRGFEVPGALVILLPPSSSNMSIRDEGFLAQRGQELRLHTPSTLLELPTPDFSMPYNVIILTSTIIALFFGSVMNRLVRGWVVVDLEEEEAEKGNDEGQEVEGESEKARLVVE